MQFVDVHKSYRMCLVISKRDPRRPEIRVGTGHPDGTTFFAIKKLVEGGGAFSHTLPHIEAGL